MLGLLVLLLFAIFYIPLIRALIYSAKAKQVNWDNIRISLIIAVLGTVFGLIILKLLNVYTEILWFNNIDYEPVFWTIFTWKWGLFIGAGFFSFIFLKTASRAIKKTLIKLQADTKKAYDEIWSAQLYPLNLITNTTIFLGSLGFAYWAMQHWNTVLLFLKRVNVDLQEPIFNFDIGFYLFSIPLLEFLIHWLLVFTLARLLIQFLSTLIYGISADKYFRDSQRRRYGQHLFRIFSKSLSFLCIILIAKTILALFNLLFSERGVAFGASYTDVFAQIVAYKTFVFVLIIAAILFIINMIARKGKIIFWTVIGSFIAWLIIIIIYPAIIQQFVVKPNELAKEAPFIDYNIKFTRAAFNLDKIEEKEFSAQGNLTAESLAQNKTTLDNIRLWDWRALWSTFKQIQEIRLYYEFDEVDIDRYSLEGRMRQLMLAPRELAIEQLPQRSKTWINQQFKYTHGYGVCANAVNEFTSEGLPQLLIRDTPPISQKGAPKITQPEIYFGERTINHIFVKTNEKEFDYPVGSSNQYTIYEGDGGIPINTFLRRLAFAWRFDGIRLLLPNPLLPESRIMFKRSIYERVKAIAPFLVYDDDPYLVIDKNGKLWWLWDAYTISNAYPYSERIRSLPDYHGEFNYIRNSVKVAVDAYNGNVFFYVMDRNDPIIQVYMKIFPDLFYSSNQMQPDFIPHLRYPEDYLGIQARVYRTYHMTDSQVFYNKEDLWEIATETYINDVRWVLPYYVIIRLPGESQEEFLQMIPFTPTLKNNMIGWMAGRCDGENYGKLLAYIFPKDKLIYGPMQIEARIDQDREISAQLTLWGQLGSRVIRGNLLVIPIDDALLYVEPLYLQAEQARMPELKQIIVAHADKLAWGKTFDEALQRIFYERAEATAPFSPLELLQKARSHFQNYQRLTGQGKFKEAAEEFDALKTIFEQIER